MIDVGCQHDSGHGNDQSGVRNIDRSRTRVMSVDISIQCELLKLEVGDKLC